jgi:hypothetical protein
MLVYVVTFVRNNVDYIVGAYSTREKAIATRKVYNARCDERDYTFIDELVLDTTKEYK